jgi:hypothetical protein
MIYLLQVMAFAPRKAKKTIGITNERPKIEGQLPKKVRAFY